MRARDNALSCNKRQMREIRLFEYAYTLHEMCQERAR